AAARHARPSFPTRRSSDLVDDAGNLGRALAFDLAEGTLNGAQLVLGTRLALADAADPARRRLSWTTRDRSLAALIGDDRPTVARSEEHTSELQSLAYLVCR